MKKYLSIGKSVLLACALVALNSCKDTWNEHYSFKETDSKYPVAKLSETLSDIEGFDKFCQVLSTTRMCDKKGKPLNMTYMDLLDEDQFLTVWAPSNASLPDSLWQRYTARNKSNAENQAVGEKFIMNHIARFKHSVGAGTDEKIYMMNGKTYNSKPEAIAGKAYHSDDMNIRCTNGVLHCIDGYMDYLPNLYEYLTTDPVYKELFGNWFSSFTREELDPTRSVSQGKNDLGETVYLDSVMIESNMLMRRYAYIHSEDSTYSVVMPTPELWNQVYNRIRPSFRYAEKYLNNDSLQDFYTLTTMMSDMFYNMNPKVQRHLPDSVFSTLYNASENKRDGKPYHVFKNPYDKQTGLFGKSIDSVRCSNGTVYIVNEWPFADSLTYVRTIKLEAESYNNLSGFSLRQNSVQIVGQDTLEKPVQVMRIAMPGMAAWTAKFWVGGHLSGKYSVKMVVAPNNVDKMPNTLHPKITFNTPTVLDSVLVDSIERQQIVDKRGKISWIENELLLENHIDRLDTFDLGIVNFPYCNYDMNSPRLAVTISSRVNELNSSKYSGELWLDGIILTPVVE